MTTTSSKTSFLPKQKVNILLKPGEVKVTSKVTLKIPEGFSEKITGKISEDSKTRVLISKEIIKLHGLADSQYLEKIGFGVIIPLSACSHVE